MLLRALDALHGAAHRRLPPLLRQFVKFGIAGGVGFTVDMGTYLILTRLAGWTTVFHVVGYEVIAPNLVSVLAAIIAVFLLNKYWTFRDPRAKELARQGVRFFVFYLATYVLNQVLTSFFAFRVPPLQTVFGPEVDVAAKILAVGVVLFVNFFGNKFLIFRAGAHAAPAPID